MRSATALILMMLARASSTVLGILFGLAETAVCIYLAWTGQWGTLALLVFIGSPILFTVAGWIAGGFAMALYGTAKLFDRDVAMKELEAW